jgi:hypothetical protein
VAETAPISLRHSCGSELHVFPPLLEALTITSRSIDLAGVLAATRIASRSRDAVTTFGALPQSIQGQSNSRWTTSLGITLAQPHAVVRASPILAGTGSLIHLPDKEFRLRPYLSITAQAEGTSGASPCMSPCRWDHIFSSNRAVWRMVSEDSAHAEQPFLLIVRTRRIVTARCSSAGFSGFPAYSQILLRQLLSYLRTVHRCCSSE